MEHEVMRNNQPITNKEYVIPQNLTLVSKTDADSDNKCNLGKRRRWSR